MKRTSRQSSAPPADRAAYERLCAVLGHTFQDEALLLEALTHPSYRNEEASCQRDNQRLEFLGDSVLGLVVATALFKARPDAAEGLLTTVRARVVSAPVLANAGRKAGISEALRVGRGMIAEGGASRDSVVSDAFEAIIGALYLDGGHVVARNVALRLLRDPLAAALAAADTGRGLRQIHMHSLNWKTAAQERLQGAGDQPPKYSLLRTDGPPHDRTFTITASATYRGVALQSEGTGRTKKAAEHVAAEALLDLLGRAGDEPGLLGGVATSGAPAEPSAQPADEPG